MCQAQVAAQNVHGAALQIFPKRTDRICRIPCTHPAQELPGAPRPAVPGAGKAVEHWGGCKVCSVPRDKGTPREGRGQGHSAGGDGAHGDPENGRVI